MRKLAPAKEGEKDEGTWNAAQVIFTQAERMAEIVRKIGKITKYETKSYVGRARILDLDKAAAEADEGHEEPPKSGPASRVNPSHDAGSASKPPGRAEIPHEKS
jgi:hypothetical protein